MEVFSRPKNGIPANWPLFCYLLFGLGMMRKTIGYCYAPMVLSAIEGLILRIQSGKISNPLSMKTYIRSVGGDIKWTGWHNDKCRQLRKRYFGSEFEDILHHEHLGYWDAQRVFYLLSGSACNRSNARRFRRAQRETAGQLLAFCQHAELIRRYMNTLKSNLLPRRFARI
jgi:hypothetical protein